MEEAKSQGLLQLPRRVKGPHMDNFKKVRIVANHYYLEAKKMEKIVIFSVKFTPTIPDDNSKLRRQILDKLKPQLSANIPNPVLCGRNIFALSEPKNKQMELREQGYTVNVRQVKVYDLKTNPKLLLAFLNNALRNSMRHLDYVQIGKTGKYFNAKQKKNIDNLVMYNGFKSNFVQLEKGIFLRVDAAKKIVRNQTVLDFIDQLYGIHRDKDKDEKRLLLKQKLVGQSVMSNYGKTVYHRVVDIRFEDMANINIPTPEANLSLPQYYKTKYGITINKPKQPLMVAEGRKKGQEILLVPELLLMTGIPQDFDDFRRKKISQNTIKPPADKMKEIGYLMEQLGKVRELDELEGIGIRLSRQMENISARIINTPMLELGNKNSVDRGREAFFQLFNKPIFNAKHAIDLGVICSKGAQLDFMLNTFDSTSKNLGVSLSFKVYEIPGRLSVVGIEKELYSCNQNNHNICLIVIPPNMKTQYKQIKMKSIEAGEMLTQVMTQALFKKQGFQSIATKILLQMLAKRGNTLWVPKPLCDIVDTMLVGYDTGKVQGKTLLALCATINSTFSTVFSDTRTYSANSDKYGKMSQLLLSATAAYYSRNKACPKEIIVFTNTCSGDQVRLYQQFFVEPTRSKLLEIYQGQVIKLTVIMINVKTNERFFVQDGNMVRNVNAGTLVAEGLVSQNYDFYLMSQQSNKGTTVPNHYKVIYSDSTLDEGQLEQLAFSQCFNYVNWTGSIKVPGILQYAKKCAKFNSQVLESNKTPKSLESKLFFI